jgi:hypothetical protein
MALGFCVAAGIIAYGFTRDAPSSMAFFSGIGFLVLGVLPFLKEHWSAGTGASKSFSAERVRRLAKFQGMLCIIAGAFFVVTASHVRIDQKWFYVLALLAMYLQWRFPFLN